MGPEGRARASWGGSTLPRRQGVSEPQGSGLHTWKQNGTSYARGKTGPQNRSLSCGHPQREPAGALGLACLVTWGLALSHCASVSPPHSLLSGAPPALRVSVLRLPWSATGHTRVPRRKGGRAACSTGHPHSLASPMLLLFSGFLKYARPLTLQGHSSGTAPARSAFLSFGAPPESPSSPPGRPLVPATQSLCSTLVG